MGRSLAVCVLFGTDKLGDSLIDVTNYLFSFSRDLTVVTV